MPRGVYIRSEKQKLNQSISAKNRGSNTKGRHWKLSKPRPLNSIKGENHWNWRGDKAKYVAIHQWLARYKIGECAFCHNKTKTEIALIHGKEYKRTFENFYELCIPCHRKYDVKKDVLIKNLMKTPTWLELNKK